MFFWVFWDFNVQDHKFLFFGGTFLIHFLKSDENLFWFFQHDFLTRLFKEGA